MSTLSKGLDALFDKLESWVILTVKALPNLLIAAAVLTGFVVASKFIYRWALQAAGKTELNESLDHLLASMAKIFVISVGIVLALSILELDKAVFSMLAGVGVIGLALGFAFQDLAANFISGLILAIRAPIGIGDLILVHGVEGTVINIRLRDTVVRTAEGHDVFIPNKIFMSEHFTNFSSHGKRRIEVIVGASYNDDLTQVKEVLLTAIQTLENALPEPAPVAYVKELGDFTIPIQVRFWVKYPGANFLGERDKAVVLLKKAMDAAGLSIPFPIRQLEFSNGLEKEVKDFLTGTRSPAK